MALLMQKLWGVMGTVVVGSFLRHRQGSDQLAPHAQDLLCPRQCVRLMLSVVQGSGAGVEAVEEKRLGSFKEVDNNVP